MAEPIRDAWQRHFYAASHSLDEQYVQLKTSLDGWHFDLLARIEDMYLNTLIELDTSYERLDSFRQTLGVLLDNEHLTDATGTKRRSLSLMDRSRFRRHLVSMTSSDLTNASTRLSWLENEMDSISNVFYQIDCQQVQLPDRPFLVHSSSSPHLHSSPIPCRVLIRREHIDHLPDPTTNALYTLLPHPRSPEAILQMKSFQQLPAVIDDLLAHTHELRVLIHASYAPVIIGQSGRGARLLKEKYALATVLVSRNRSRGRYS